MMGYVCCYNFEKVAIAQLHMQTKGDMVREKGIKITILKPSEERERYDDDDITRCKQA